MVDDVPLRTAVHTVWSLYLAGIATSMLPTPAAACWSVICKGDGKRV
jgi:hypothetical protein